MYFRSRGKCLGKRNAGRENSSHCRLVLPFFFPCLFCKDIDSEKENPHSVPPMTRTTQRVEFTRALFLVVAFLCIGKEQYLSLCLPCRAPSSRKPTGVDREQANFGALPNFSFVVFYLEVLFSSFSVPLLFRSQASLPFLKFECDDVLSITHRRV